MFYREKKPKKKTLASSSGIPSGTKKDGNIRKSLLAANFKKGNQSLDSSAQDDDLVVGTSNDTDATLDRRRRRKKNHAERDV